jgi:hypothetical protein
VKALNCNYGHKAQPGFERFLKVPARRHPPAHAGAPGEQGLAPANVRLRKLQGDGTCFNSAVEAIVIPGPEDMPPPAVRDLLAAHPDKHYAVKSFPTTGKTQVPGVLLVGLEDGAFIARLWARYLTQAGVGLRADVPVELPPAEDLGHGAGRLPPPDLELEQPVARRRVTLREEQVGLVLGVDVIDAPPVGHDLDRCPQTGELQRVPLRRHEGAVARHTEREHGYRNLLHPP